MEGPPSSDGGPGSRWRWRESNPRPKNSNKDIYKLSRPLLLGQGVAADNATPGTSRWEPRLPLEHPYRRRDAARQLLDTRPPVRWRETRASVIGLCDQGCSQTTLRLPKEQRQMRTEEQESKCCFWHFGKCAPFLRGQSAPACSPCPAFPVEACHPQATHIIAHARQPGKGPGQSHLNPNASR